MPRPSIFPDLPRCGPGPADDRPSRPPPHLGSGERSNGDRFDSCADECGSATCDATADRCAGAADSDESGTRLWLELEIRQLRAAWRDATLALAGTERSLRVREEELASVEQSVAAAEWRRPVLYAIAPVGRPVPETQTGSVRPPVREQVVPIDVHRVISHTGRAVDVIA